MGKTADQIFDIVVALCNWESSDKTDYETIFLQDLNIIMAECFRANNGLRRLRGKAPLEEMPEVTEKTDAPGYEDLFERMILPYGVASLIYVEDDETGITNVYRSKYLEALAENTTARFTEAEEEYREGET